MKTKKEKQIGLSDYTPKSKKVFWEGKQVVRVQLQSKDSNSK